MNPSSFTIDQVNAQADALEAAQTKGFSDANAYIQKLIAKGGATVDQLNTLGNHLKAMTDATTAFDINNSEPVLPIPTLPPTV